MRTDSRAYELVVQYDGRFESSTRLFRIPIPADTREKARPVSVRGAYGLLDVDNDASADEIREA